METPNPRKGGENERKREVDIKKREKKN